MGKQLGLLISHFSHYFITSHHPHSHSPNRIHVKSVLDVIHVPSHDECRRRFGALAMRKIYTYYQPIHGFRDDRDLLDIWQRSWRSKCWEPVILDESFAVQHSSYHYLNAKLSAIPTINPKEYERSCYIRYIAMSVVGGGITVDNDVMNVGFWPNDVPDPLPERFHVSGSHVPALMYASGQEYDRVVHYMANYTLTARDRYDGRPHTSDMYIIVHMIERKLVDTIPDNPFNNDKVRGKKLIHLSSSLTSWTRNITGVRDLDKVGLASIVLCLSNKS